MKIGIDYCTLSPAYGRDYKSKKEVEEAFREGKDFLFESLSGGHCGSYCSIRDFAEGVRVNIRYGKMRKVAVLET
jgi:hypothetical protein